MIHDSWPFVTPFPQNCFLRLYGFLLKSLPGFPWFPGFHEVGAKNMKYIVSWVDHLILLQLQWMVFTVDTMLDLKANMVMNSLNMSLNLMAA